MNRRNTLNTRLLPLSILISSLVSGGAIAAPTETPIFDAAGYKQVETLGNAINDDSKWTAELKQQIGAITDSITKLTATNDDAQKSLTDAKEFDKHQATVTDLNGAEQKQADAKKAVTDMAGEVITDAQKLPAKDQGILGSGSKGEQEQLVVGDDSKADKDKLKGLIATIRTAQEDYQTALATAKTVIADDGTTPLKGDEDVLTDLADKKSAFKKAVSAFENVELEGDLVFKDTYPDQLAKFYEEIDFAANTTDLDTAHKEITAFTDLLPAREAAIEAFSKFEVAQSYITGNPTHKLAADEQAKLENDVQKNTDELLSLEGVQTALIPTQGTAVVKTGELARNEIVDTDDQTIETGGASLDNRIIGKTQTVADGAITKNSIISEAGGKQVLEAGAQAIATVVNDLAVLENNGGIDYDSVINEGGTLTLKGEKTTDPDGKEVVTTAKSYNATIVEGGKATVGEFAEIHNLTSTKGTVTLEKGAKASNTRIGGGTLTIEAGANAQYTTLINTKLDLVEGAIADATTVSADSIFTLKTNATTSGTQLVGDNSEFIVEKGASASTSLVSNGKMTVQDGGKATGTILAGKQGGELILESGAKAKGTAVHARNNTFTIKSGAEALDTELYFAELKLEDGATADSTKLYQGSTFTLLDGAETKGTLVRDQSQFIVNANAMANNTTLSNGTFKLLGTANTTIVNGGVFDVQAGAEAKNTTLSNGTFKLLGTANTTIVNGGVFDVQAGATANDTTVHGGKFNLMEQAKASKLLVENGYALIAGTLQDAITLNGGTTTFYKTATVSGTIDSGKNSVITLHEGAKTQAADLNLAGNMNLIGATAVQQAVVQRSALPGSNGHPAQFAFKDVTLNSGTIDMSTNAQLTMASLAGNGNFNLAPSLYNQANAPLNVTGDAAGTFGIQLKDSGVAPTNLNLINVGGDSTARFALSNGPVNLGNYQHNLIPDGKGGFMLKADTTALTPSTAGVLAVANTMPVIFNAELSSIQNRLDKQSTSANESGVWINYLNDNFDVKGTAANFKQKLNGVTLGGDKAIALGDSVLSLGGFASHSSSDIKSDYQSSGSVESNSLGAYAQYLSNSGYYLNGVLKTNQFKQKLNITSNGNNANGSANFSGLGLAVKAGKHINFDAMYVSPYIALNTFASGKSQYQLSNGMDAQNQGSRNTTGTLGMNTGY
ncbi:autotransporter outer membrane beta-barrel domain-containing protein, partial [Yersinia aleksiciae]|uniref:autotransporter outer membrane beta-barrel domain-containing protein n=1 Tax=Yersinia aleksiciae TaxID=263819 RepID=UPI0021BD3DFA